MADNSSSKQGFASLPDKELREISSKGGKAQGKENNPGNFANRDPKEVREAAREGGSK